MPGPHAALATPGGVLRLPIVGIVKDWSDQLGTILCGAASANACEQVDTGGYQVTTTLDWSMQQTVEKWLEAAGPAPDQKEPRPPLAPAPGRPRHSVQR